MLEIPISQMKKMVLNPSTARQKQGQNCRISLLCLLMGRCPYFTLLENKKFQDVPGVIQKIANVFSFTEKLKKESPEISPESLDESESSESSVVGGGGTKHLNSVGW